MRTFVSFPINDLERIKRKMLGWTDRFDIFCFLDDHAYGLPGHAVECLLGAGASDQVEALAGHALASLSAFTQTKQDWLFGHFGYGLSRETEPFQGTKDRPDTLRHPDPIGFPDLFFFVPRYVIELQANGYLSIGSSENDHAAVFEEIMSTMTDESGLSATAPTPATPLMQARFSREEYLDTVERLRHHIHRGDCYEINFCQEFFASPVTIDPLSTWISLSRRSPNPFAAYYRTGSRYLLCASPERFLQRRGDVLLSQPIKGTWPRTAAYATTGRGSAYTGDFDQPGRERLFQSDKDRSENVMVVDLVRNDLSKICAEGSVKVEELFGIYTFPQVHQMISSITGRLPPDKGLADCIGATFPMGSMTGAPKNRVVELIDRYERSPRGLFSGAVGYVRPGGDFDFNVVIRSLFYNAENRYLSYQVGSGITFYSDPELEYEECRWKAEGIRKALGMPAAPVF